MGFCCSESIFLPLSSLVVAKHIFYLWLSQCLDLCIQNHCSLGIEFNYWNRKVTQTRTHCSHETGSQNSENVCSCSPGPPIFQAPPLSLCFVILNISFHPTKPSMSKRMGISSISHPHSKWKEKGGKEQGKERGGRENR